MPGRQLASSDLPAPGGPEQLGNLIAIYDSNQISIEDDTNIAFTEDVAARYEAYGWQVQTVDWKKTGEYVEDVAALNDHVMLPWDVWGAMTQKDEEIDTAFIDRLAALTVEPDRHFGELRAVYRDPRVQVPPTVFNAVRNRPETL